MQFHKYSKTNNGQKHYIIINKVGGTDSPSVVSYITAEVGRGLGRDVTV